MGGAMLTVGRIQAIENSTWFHAGWAPNLIVDGDLRIRAVNTAYERATGQPSERLIGERLFEAFPDNPADPQSDGVANLSRSLEMVFRRGTRHWMGVQRYDVRDPREPAEFVYKVWTPVNSPIKDRGRTVAILHQIRDVTRSMPARQIAGRGLADLRRSADALCRQFAALPAGMVLGVLAQSYDVVMATLGRASIEQAEALARLRFEIRDE